MIRLAAFNVFNKSEARRCGLPLGGRQPDGAGRLLHVDRSAKAVSKQLIKVQRD